MMAMSEVQLLDRAGGVAQGGHLADHVHPLGRLLPGRQGPELRGARQAAVVRVAIDPLRGDAQPAEVERLEHVADLLGRAALRQEPAPLALEGAGERRVDAARRVAGPGLQEDGALAADRGLLEPLDDRPRGDRLAREQIGGAQEHADPRAALGQRGGQRRHHRGAERVVDAGGEQEMALRDLVGGQRLEDRVDHGVPQDERRARPDVAAALAPLEHEAARSALQEQLQEPRRRHVQVGRDAVALKGQGLVGAAAGDQGERGAELADDLELLLAQLQRHEAEDADPPRALAQRAARLLQESPRLGGAHQRQGQERQPAAPGDLEGKGGRVADAGHRTLHDGIAGPVRACQGAVLVERPQGPRGGHVRVDRLAHPPDDAAHGAKPPGEGRRERGVLAEDQRLALRIVPAAALRDRLSQGGPAGSRRRVRRGQGARRAPQIVAGLQTGPVVKAPGLAGAPEQGGLAAVHAADGVAGRARQG